MEISDKCESSDMKCHRRRSVISRLWESYAVDLITILEAANKGKCTRRVAQESMAEIVPKMKMLREGGRLEQALQKAEMIMVDKVFNDVTESD